MIYEVGPRYSIVLSKRKISYINSLFKCDPSPNLTIFTFIRIGGYDFNYLSKTFKNKINLKLYLKFIKKWKINQSYKNPHAAREHKFFNCSSENWRE